MSTETLVFATRADYSSGLSTLEKEHSLKYTRAGDSDLDVISTYQSAFDIPNLGLSLKGDSNHDPDYLVTAVGAKIVTAHVPQKNGGIRYFIDLDGNPAGILFRPAGLFQGRCIIRGRIAATTNPESARIYHIFLGYVTKNFKRVREFLIGPEAYKLCQSDARLTISARYPESYDLRVKKAGSDEVELT
jgi:hypothetical protein